MTDGQNTFITSLQKSTKGRKFACEPNGPPAGVRDETALLLLQSGQDTVYAYTTMLLVISNGLEGNEGASMGRVG